MSYPAAGETARSLPSGTLAVIAVACALTVANVYINQPLLAAIAREFAVSEREAGLVATASQVGYGIGILFVVPLGDIAPVRRLIGILLAATGAALAAAAFAPGIAALSLFSLCIGAATVVPQILMPLAASLAPPGRQGQVIGWVQTGLVSGIVLARALAGYVGDLLGWRAVYILSAASMLALLVLLPGRLPPRADRPGLGYGALMRSLGTLFFAEPMLRLSCLLGALVFGGFSAFWTTVIFFLELPPYVWGPTGVAILSLAGAPATVLGGRFGSVIDRRGTGFASALALAAAFAGYAVCGAFGANLGALVLGASLLNLASTLNQISNQARIFRLRPDARSRLNTVYMVCAFTGGALGSFLGAWAWARLGWWGVNGVGLLAIGGAAAALWAARKRS
jgi:predicted MFS family arabinose efflux permease